MHRLLLTLSMAVSLTAVGQNLYKRSAAEDIKGNAFLCASEYLAYDNHPATQALTPTPAGYEPFYFTHYGRHGSRWLIDKEQYTKPLYALQRAHAQGKLTATGEATWQAVEAIYATTHQRRGDLTTVGERQHHGIAKRIIRNFPEIFLTKDLPIDARSTVINRCILSMIAECEEFAAANPSIRFHNDVSESLQYYLNQPHDGIVKATNADATAREYAEKLTHPERLMPILFNDQQWVKDSLNAGSFMRALFNLATNMQSHYDGIDLLHLFTPEEQYDQWRINNIRWYMSHGPAPQTNGVKPFAQRNLLHNFIATADTTTQVQATMRFGHESCLMPFASLLELGPTRYPVENLDTLDRVWRNYNIFPMASNIQLIFYRPTGSKVGTTDNSVLVKCLLNEREVSMPAQPVSGPYYRWADLRQYYLEKLRFFEEKYKNHES